MSENTNTDAKAAEPSLQEQVQAASEAAAKAYLAFIVAFARSIPSRLTGLGAKCVPSYKTLAVVGTVCFLGLLAVSVGSAIETGNVVQAAQKELAATAQQLANRPTIGQRVYGAGQTVYGYTIQPAVNADGAVKNRVFGSAPAVVAQAPAAK
jgi:hypothetical protein